LVSLDNRGGRFGYIKRQTAMIAKRITV